MFITPMMLEPTTASIAVYLLSKTTTLKRNIIEKKPFYYKKKICKWLYKNKHTIIDVGLDELFDLLLESTNNIHIISKYSSIFIIMYFTLLIIMIIF